MQLEKLQRAIKATTPKPDGLICNKPFPLAASSIDGIPVYFNTSAAWDLRSMQDIYWFPLWTNRKHSTSDNQRKFAAAFQK